MRDSIDWRVIIWFVVLAAVLLCTVAGVIFALWKGGLL